MSFFSQIAEVSQELCISGASAVVPQKLMQHHITSVINLTMEVPNPNLPGLKCIKIFIDDNPHARLSEHFDRCADIINDVRKNGGVTLVHCIAGVSRSASVCIAYLMKYHRMSLNQAFTHVKKRRPVIRPNVGFFRQLIEYEKKLFGKTSVKMVQTPQGCVPDVYYEETKHMVWMPTHREVHKRW